MIERWVPRTVDLAEGSTSDLVKHDEWTPWFPLFERSGCTEAAGNPDNTSPSD